MWESFLLIKKNLEPTDTSTPVKGIFQSQDTNWAVPEREVAG